MAFPPSTRLFLSFLLSRCLAGTLKLVENEKDDENEAEKDAASVGAEVPATGAAVAATGADVGAAVTATGAAVAATGAAVGAPVAATGAAVAATGADVGALVAATGA